MFGLLSYLLNVIKEFIIMTFLHNWSNITREILQIADC